MSFVAELKQRKVVRVAMVYLVVAWVAIQAASIALPTFDAPAWMLRVVILLFALGFPLALLLTWALDLTPGGLRLAEGTFGNRRIAAIAAGLAVLALAWYFIGQPAVRGGADAAPERSIAVLPFVNMSGDRANDYFSDGLADTTLDMLAQVQDLKVIARTSSFAFKGRNSDMREIGRTLGAANLLEGSVQQAGDTVRITVQLIRAADGSHLWSKHFDRRMADVFSIQDEIATAVVQALQIALPKAEQQRLVRRRTDNVDAYQEYLKGIALMPDRKVPEMRAAAQHFERAIALDPGYARAYVAAADTYNLLNQYATITPAEAERASRYVDRALMLEPDLGEAHISRAAALEIEGDFSAAEREFRRGLQLAPGYATGYQWYAEFLTGEFGRFDEGLPLNRKAVELDPLSAVIRGNYIFNLDQSGRPDEAMAMSNQMIAEHPDVASSYDTRSVSYRQRGDMVAALRDLRMQDTLDPASSGNRAHRCLVLIDISAVAEGRTCLAKLAENGPASGTTLFGQARLAMIAGDAPGALALLSQMRPPLDRGRAFVLLASGRAAEALAIHRRLLPRLFVQPTPKVYPGEAAQAIEAGSALIRTGAPTQGRALIQAGIAAVAGRPYGALIAGRGWLDVLGYAQLGETEQAFAALRDGVDHGYFLELADLDANPLLAGLRTDPRYMKILAPARSRAAAQVEAARRAELL